MEKPTCLCGEEMTFLMDNKRHAIWECHNCGRLLLRPNYAEWQRWYFPEAGLKEGWDSKKAKTTLSMPQSGDELGYEFS